MEKEMVENGSPKEVTFPLVSIEKETSLSRPFVPYVPVITLPDKSTEEDSSNEIETLDSDLVKPQPEKAPIKDGPAPFISIEKEAIEKKSPKRSFRSAFVIILIVLILVFLSLIISFLVYSTISKQPPIVANYTNYTNFTQLGNQTNETPTPIINTTSPIVNISKGRGSGMGGGSGGVNPPPCTPESKETTCGNFCGIKKNNCNQDVECSCQNGTYCYIGDGINNICINDSVSCIDSENDYYKKGNVTANNSGVFLFKEDICLENLKEFYCYYNGSAFEARNQSYNCSNGCSNGSCLYSQCERDENCSLLSGVCGTGFCNLTSRNCYINYTVGNVCRNSSGSCDSVERCTGSSSSCPVDVFNSSSTVCRFSAGSCDSVERCTGSSSSCPVDVFNSSSTVCRFSAGSCDSVERCTGSSSSCPVDVFNSSSTVCRFSAGSCDSVERCTGSSSICPLDVFNSSSTVCRFSAGSCDSVERCTGSSSICPLDVFNSSSTVCRASAFECDAIESCTGVSSSCPNNLNKTDGLSCSVGTCTHGQCTSSVCPGTDISCGTYPSCLSCNAQDNCYSLQRRDYYCNSSNHCSFNLITKTENLTNNNCNDFIDNDCDGSNDSGDTGCINPFCVGKDDCTDYAAQSDCISDACNLGCIWQHGSCVDASDAENILILANVNVPESVELAIFYSKRRGVPNDQILYLDTTTSEYISFNTSSGYDYNRSIEIPTKNKIIQLNSQGKKIYYILTTYGVPAYLYVPSEWRNWGYGTTRSLDSYLAGMFYNNYTTGKDMISNPYYYTSSCKNKSDPYCYNLTHVKDMKFSYPLLLVTRLDGSLDVAKNMVDRARYAEKYFSKENSGEGYFLGYMSATIKPCRGVFWKRGYYCYGETDYYSEGSRNNLEKTFGEQKSSNNFYNEFDFAPGALNSRFQSFTAAEGLRNSNHDTFAVGSIFSGVTALSGSANEPYTTGVVKVDKMWDAFLDHYLIEPEKGNFNFAEAAYYGTYYLRWMPIMLGDPLFKYPAGNALTDNEAPLIENVSIRNISSHSANISFLTEKSLAGYPEVTRAYIKYGLTTSYGKVKNDSQYFSYLDSFAFPFDSHHEVVIDGLKENSLYHYKIFAVDPAGNVQESPDFTLTTLSTTSDPVRNVSSFSVKGGNNLVQVKWFYKNLDRVDIFEVYKDGLLLSSSTKDEFYLDTNVVNNAIHLYKMRVKDINGNYGPFTDEISVTVQKRVEETPGIYLADYGDAGFVYETRYIANILDYSSADAFAGDYQLFDSPSSVGNFSFYFNLQEDGFYQVHEGPYASLTSFPGKKAQIYHNGTVDYAIELVLKDGLQAPSQWRDFGTYYFNKGLNKIIITKSNSYRTYFDAVKLEKVAGSACDLNPQDCGTNKMGYSKPIDSSIKILYHFDNDQTYKEDGSFVYDFSKKGNNGTFISGVITDQICAPSSTSWAKYPLVSKILVGNVISSRLRGMILEVTSGRSLGFKTKVMDFLGGSWTNESILVKDAFPYALEPGDHYSIYVDKEKNFTQGIFGKSINSDSLDYVSSSLVTPLNISNNREFTFEVWFKKNITNNIPSGYLFTAGGIGVGAENGRLTLYYGSGWEYKYPDGNEIFCTYDSNYWQHFVVTNKESIMKMYLNGQYLGDANISGKSVDALVTGISVGQFLGYTDEFVFYDKELTYDEIKNNFKSKYSSPAIELHESSIIFNWLKSLVNSQVIKEITGYFIKLR